jgi:splicing factor 3B subunit 1
MLTSLSPFPPATAHGLHLQVPELNVQNGVLKALSFLFEYIGEMGKDYIYAGGQLYRRFC